MIAKCGHYKCRSSAAVFALCAALSTVSVPPANARAVANTKSGVVDHIYFTSKTNRAGAPGTKESNTFDCSQKVYVVVVAGHIKPGIRHVVVYWYNPLGRRQEDTEFDVNATGRKDRFWAWLILHRSPDNMMDRVLLQDRGAGMEDFIGKWTVKIYVDGKLLGTGTFKIYC